ncbi:MAG: hypothetical protein JRJ03_04065 [Deltaproteobacteria bacterium]|nr:hypothetical protein [Deltaproteobacteria bacterium]
MLRCIITGEPEVQPIIAIIQKEYDLIQDGDDLDSMAYGVPAKIGAYGVEKIYELDVEDIREEILRSAEIIKGDTRAAADILREKFNLN